MCIVEASSLRAVLYEQSLPRKPLLEQAWAACGVTAAMQIPNSNSFSTKEGKSSF